jgi:uncharacterized membrane protein YccC
MDLMGIYKQRKELILMKQNPLLEAALAERQEYLEELEEAQRVIDEQIKTVQQDMERLLVKLL